WSLVRPSVIQIVLNAVGISGFFLALRAFSERLAGFELFPGALWIIATLASLTFVNALLRKTQAVVLILLEAVAGAPPVERYPWRTRLLLAAAAVCAAWWYLSISLFLLPPWPYAPLPVLFIAVAALALWRRTSRVYGLLQAALRESIGRAGSRPETAAAALSVFVDSASPENLRITAYELGEDWWAAGRRIGELDLRSTTGTTLVQVNRAQASIPFLSPDRQLQPRDELLIIGEAGDLRRAYERLRFGPSEP